MKVRIADRRLARVVAEPDFNGGMSAPLAKKVRQRVQFLCDASDERDLRAMASLHFEKLKGGRAHQHSVMLDKQWRLILEFEGQGTSTVAVVVAVEDYH